MAANRRWQILGVGIVVAIPLLVVFVLAIRAAVMDYLQSSEFRSLIAIQTGNALGGKADFQPLQWKGTEVFSPGLVLESGRHLTRLEADGLRGSMDWRAVFEGEWRMPHLEVGRATVVILPGDGKIPATAPSTEPATAKTRLPGWLPVRFRMERVSIRDLDIDWGGALPARLEGSQAVLNSRGTNWEITGRGGSLEVKGWPELNCVEFAGRLVPGTFYLTKSEFTHGESGKIRMTADVSSQTTWQGDWEGLDAGPWLPGSWRPYLSGRLRGSAKSLADGLISGEVTLENGTLQGLPILDRMAKFTASPQFRKLPVSQLSGNFSLESGRWKWTNMICESRGLLRAEGTLNIGAAGELEGVFQVGVGPQVLQWIPGSKERVFTRNADGYVWTQVRIGGTLRDPQEDLSARLMIAAGEDVIQRGVETLQSAPDAAREGVKGALDILAPLFR
ncbi:MAG: hypothetical protein Fur0032_11010 [Terrimicrobiaceae bacterium]